MAEKRGCCGGYPVKKTKTVEKPLPPNPTVKGGIAVIYIGSGNIILKGKESGLSYYASDHNRHFRIFSEDVSSVLKDSRIILKP